MSTTYDDFLLFQVQYGEEIIQATENMEVYLMIDLSRLYSFTSLAKLCVIM